MFSHLTLLYHTLETLIWLVVIVPVLSVQMTVVHPRVSTDVSDRTIAFLAAIFLVPNARHVVTTAGRPSGIAATVIITEYYTGVTPVQKMDRTSKLESNIT